MARRAMAMEGVIRGRVTAGRSSPRADCGNTNDGDVVPSLDALERTMTENLSRLGDDAVENIFLGDKSSSSAHVVMIARGPVKCLVAQYCCVLSTLVLIFSYMSRSIMINHDLLDFIE